MPKIYCPECHEWSFHALALEKKLARVIALGLEAEFNLLLPREVAELKQMQKDLGMKTGEDGL